MPPKLLFVPVSGAFGMGEYARCLNLAQAFAVRRPDAQIHFLLSAQAPYAKELPFESTVLPSSPTFHTPQVRELIQQMRPDIVVFDNAGRTAQLEAARGSGAKVVFISARHRQRRKAFRWRWMRMLDEHWIAYPEFIAGPPSSLERLKLHWLKRPQIRFLNCLLPTIAAEEEAALFAAAGAKPGQYVLVVPGGGTGHPGAGDAVDVFFQAAREIASHGIPVIFVAPCIRAPHGNPICLDLMPLANLIALMRGAKAMLTNGGGTLIQAIGCHAATVSVPIARDQAGRIALCAGRGLTRSTELDAAGMTLAVLGLLEDAAGRDQLRSNARALSLQDATRTAIDALDGLLPR